MMRRESQIASPSRISRGPRPAHSEPEPWPPIALAPRRRASWTTSSRPQLARNTAAGAKPVRRCPAAVERDTSSERMTSSRGSERPQPALGAGANPPLRSASGCRVPEVVRAAARAPGTRRSCARGSRRGVAACSRALAWPCWRNAHQSDARRTSAWVTTGRPGSARTSGEGHRNRNGQLHRGRLDPDRRPRSANSRSRVKLRLPRM